MVIRIKSKWHQSDRNAPSPRTLQDHAGALAFIIWRLSLEGAKRLHGDGFEYLNDKQRVGVITEFVAFLVQATDRLSHAHLPDEERAVFINTLAQRVADHIQDNLQDIAGPGNYRAPFIDALNRRLSDYAQTEYQDDRPGFETQRYFGDRVLKTLPTSQTNRWVIDQIMDIEAPEVFAKLSKALLDLFGTSGD